MKKLIVTTAVAATILTSGYMVHEHQVEQLQHKYNVQLNTVEKENKAWQTSYKSLKNINKGLSNNNTELKKTIEQQQQQIQSQSEEIAKLKKQIDESPRWVTFSASAYTTHTNGDPWTSGKWGNKTASGTVPTQGRTIAVDRHLIPLGTKLLVQFPEPYSRLNGTYIAEDTGNGIKGNEVDLYLENYKECINFGVRDIKIKIIN